MSTILEQMAKLEIPVTSENIQKALAENQSNDETTRMLLDTIRVATPTFQRNGNQSYVLVLCATENTYKYITNDGTEPTTTNYSQLGQPGESAIMVPLSTGHNVIKVMCACEGRIQSFTATGEFDYEAINYAFFNADDLDNNLIGATNQDYDSGVEFLDFDGEGNPIIKDEYVTMQLSKIMDVQTETVEYEGIEYYKVVFPDGTKSIVYQDMNGTYQMTNDFGVYIWITVM